MRISASALALLACLCLAGCGLHAAGPPEAIARPSDVLDFTTLYQQNCSACHGSEGSNGPAIDLANPVYEALIDDNTLRKLISAGIPGTQMPAFAIADGGMLTDAQVGSLVQGMRKAWSRPNAFAGATPPPYAQAGSSGDAARGAKTYQARCAMCHANSSQQITSPTYLALVDDQSLRSYMIAGSPDIGQPDWMHDSAGGKASAPLSSQDVDDVVAYLSGLRNPAPNVTGKAPSPKPGNKNER